MMAHIHRKKIMQNERILEPHMNIDNDDVDDDVTTRY